LSLPDPHRISLVDLLMEYEGIRLFVERAITARADFALTDRNASFVAEICRQLDGIPLAIELAAAKIKVLSVEQIAARLNDMFQLLTGGSRAALPRHQTLQAALDWSYELLTTKERLLFCRLAVFSGGWTLEAMEAVCSTADFEGNEVIDLLSSLVDKSLVIREEMPDGGVRIRMLETIRQYAHKALSGSGQTETFQKRHLDYFVNMVETVNPHLGFFLPDPQIASWANILELEQDNLWTAFKFCWTDPSHKEPGLRMAAMLHWFWFVRGYFTEGRNLLDQLLAGSGEVSLPVQAQAFLSAGFLACWQGDFSSARTSLEKSLKAFEEMEEPAGIAFSLHGLGFAANGLGDHAQAGALFGRCQELARKTGDKWLLSFALHFISIGNSFQGNYELAVSQFEECIKLIKGGTGNLPGVAFSLFHLGRIARIQDDHKSAHSHHSEGIRLFWQMGDRRGIGYSLSGFACLALAEKKTARAARLIGAVDSIREDLGSLLETILQIEFEQTRIAVQKTMGREKYGAAWSEGRALPLDQAFRLAISR
jgi:predicted ATPase